MYPGKPRPYGAPPGPPPAPRPIGQPAWINWDGRVPVVGPSGNSPSRRFFGDRREEAYANYVQRISNAWRNHRR
jgi:hypothetical protein